MFYFLSSWLAYTLSLLGIKAFVSESWTEGIMLWYQARLKLPGAFVSPEY